MKKPPCGEAASSFNRMRFALIVVLVIEYGVRVAGWGADDTVVVSRVALAVVVVTSQG